MIGIDPGRVTGWAVFLPDGGIVSGIWKILDTAAPRDLLAAWAARMPTVIEKPRDRPGQRKATVNDLIELAWRAGIAEGTARAYGSAVSTCYPEQWKGSLQKAVSHERIAKFLRRPTPRDHNEADAWGIGLYGLGHIPCLMRVIP